jgi:hypothetical protein
MTRTGSYTYRLKLKLKRTGSAGTLRLSLSATNRSGGANRASRTFPLH